MEATRRKLDLFPDIHVTVVGVHTDVKPDDFRDPPPWLEDVDRIILASPTVDEELIAELVAFCRQREIRLSFVPPVRGMFATAVSLKHVADLPVVEYGTWDVSRSTLALKRVLDVVVSTVLLIFLVPLVVACAVVIVATSGCPVLFRQRRAGLHGKPFWMLKFRTMVPNASELLEDLVALDKLDEPVFKLVNDPRVTRVGRVMRRLSLDELPQLVNVLVGHMSLVGPRPEQVELADRYVGEQRLRLSVKPGLTGPMQVFGRGQLSFEERLAVERDYIENLSLSRDLRILALTVSAVFGGRGAY